VLDLGRPQQQLLAAALAVDANRSVTTDGLIDRIWDDPPSGARRTLHVLVTRLRRILEQAASPDVAPRVIRRGGGYLLDADPDRVDVLRFHRLVDHAHGLGDQGRRADLLRSALQLWRGEPLSGLVTSWAVRTRATWRLQYLEASIRWASAELQDGNASTVIAPLRDLMIEHPLTESVAEVLMQALHATGRSSEALALYRDLRRRLAEEVGTDPSPDLQQVHQRILRGKPSFLSPASHQTSHQPERHAHRQSEKQSVPRQLPAAERHFTGRATELALLVTSKSRSQIQWRLHLGDVPLNHW